MDEEHKNAERAVLIKHRDILSGEVARLDPMFKMSMTGVHAAPGVEDADLRFF